MKPEDQIIFAQWLLFIFCLLGFYQFAEMVVWFASHISIKWVAS